VQFNAVVYLGLGIEASRGRGVLCQWGNVWEVGVHSDAPFQQLCLEMFSSYQSEGSGKYTTRSKPQTFQTVRNESLPLNIICPACFAVNNFYQQHN